MLKELCSWYPKTVPDLFQMLQFGLWWEKHGLNLLALFLILFIAFLLKYCYKTSSVQASVVSLILKLSAIL